MVNKPVTIPNQEDIYNCVLDEMMNSVPLCYMNELAVLTNIHSLFFHRSIMARHCTLSTLNLMTMRWSWWPWGRNGWPRGQRWWPRGGIADPEARSVDPQVGMADPEARSVDPEVGKADPKVFLVTLRSSWWTCWPRGWSFLGEAF